jgi:hypothetical protein
LRGLLVTYTEHWLAIEPAPLPRWVLTRCTWCGKDFEVKVRAVEESLRKHQQTEPHRLARERMEAA